ncbi:MAG: ABC transporter permease [Rhodospirillaceae bacterium]|nr:ABC transporter permease [Rhodospirillaceae bacterium]
MNIATLIAQRVALGILSLFLVSILIFVGTEILPGDVATAILGRSATPDAVANIRRDLGLDDPAIFRYFHWLASFVQGDLGVSLSNGQDIAQSVGRRLQNTLFLAGTAAIASIPLAVFLGMVAVHYKDGFVDKFISMTTLAAISLPEFFVGYMLILFFSMTLGWFDPIVSLNDSMSFLERLYAIILPVMTLTLVVLAHMMRMTRAAILNVMTSSYIETAELKGLSGGVVIFLHAFPNAISPIINVVVLNMAYLVVGVVVVEVIFVYPGMGQFMVDHVAKRDVPVVQACGLIFGGIYIFFNLTADIISIISNPRLRHPR